MDKALIEALGVSSIENFDQEYALVEKIGHGQENSKRNRLNFCRRYGAVYKARHKQTGTIIAVKNLPVMQQDLQELTNEINFMKDCDSDFIVRYYGWFLKGKVMWVSY